MTPSQRKATHVAIVCKIHFGDQIVENTISVL